MFGLKRILGRAIGPSRVMAIALAALVLSACGQRGPLYLPGPEAAKPRKSPPASTVPAETPATPTER
ncbi:MAG: lipoprotein [Hydrogenophaga sp.]|uniref:LPS translocon maturation chaperone LptM n=1 Tax=Hydrogenophaga sp. TaxID=1904254 RepID=UPI002A044BB8|nr:lipoprotein [Hydrogenophaga sp.]